jgi:hypothetical protein
MSSCRVVLNDSHDLLGGSVGILMLPEAQYRPSCRSKSGVRIFVTRDVGCDLARPIVRVVLEHSSAVVGAAMPEAAIDEDGHSRPGEDDVGCPAQTGLGRD